MKEIIFSILLLVNLSVMAQSDASKKPNELTWYTDILKANEISVATNKPIFAFFTGSDWCGWCKKLQRDVFAKPEFIQWAIKNVVLLELDFPRRTPQSPELAQQNASLQQTFQVQGYPTVWLFFMNKDEKTKQINISPLGSLGYPQAPESGKEEIQFLMEANTILERKNSK
jgi:thioredoxin-related protein